jgi:heme-degrading monooxygenase HmoA
VIAATPEPPYLAVIFSSQRTRCAEGNADERGYAAMAERMVELARLQPGFLGVESARDAEGFGITVSYWRDEAAIAAWKAHAEHAVAQRLGREAWYGEFQLRVCRVEREGRMGRP